MPTTTRVRICVPDIPLSPLRWAGRLSTSAKRRFGDNGEKVTKDEIRDLFASDLAQQTRARRLARAT